MNAQKTRGFAASLKAKVAATTAIAIAAASSAHAALPSDVSTAIGDYKEDALAAIGLVMAAGVAIWGLKKLASKLGWL